MEDAKAGNHEVPLEKTMSGDGSEYADDSARDWTAEEEKKLM